MRILIIHNKYKIQGGEDSVVLNEQYLLQNFGQEVRVVYFDNVDISSIFQKITVAAGVLYNNSSKKILKTEIEDFCPDIIHVHNIFPKISPSIFFLANKLNIPIVQTIHNYRMICPSATLLFNSKVFEKSLEQSFAWSAIKHKVYRSSYLQTFILAFHNFFHNIIGTWKNKVDGFIFLTVFAKRKFIDSKLLLDEKKIFIKPNFVEDKGFNYDREKHFLFVGRLSEEKGIDVLLKVFSKTKHVIRIIGTGPLESHVVKTALVNPNIRYLGKQSSKRVIEEMKACRALIFPSIWYEGMPMTILEAYSTGCPVISSNIGAMKNLINHKYNGLHFEPGKSGDLLSKLDHVTDEMPWNARKSYLEQFTPEQNYKLLMNIYKKVVDEKTSNN